MSTETMPLHEGTRHSLTRREVAAHLGVSIASVRCMEFGRLHPVQDEHGVWRFDPDEVEALAHRPVVLARRSTPLSEQEREANRAGRLAARVFRLFARGASLPHIVIATKQPPERIRALYHEWSTSLDEAVMERAIRS